MKVSLLGRTVALSGVALLGLAACGGGSSSGNTGSGGGGISGSGSTFQQTIEQQWTSDFTGAQITYTGVGSSTGVANFTQGTNDFAGSDVTLTSDEQSSANQRCNSTALTFPVTAGGIAIIYNLQGITGIKLDAPTIAKIFQGQITTWDDPAIKALNPNLNLPSTPIAPYHRSDGSGTTSVLSSFLTSQAKGVWTLGAGETLNWPSNAGQAADGSSGVTAGVSQTQGGITYAEQSYVQGSLQAAQVKNAQGQYVTISPASVSQSIATGLTFSGGNNSLAGTLNFAAMTGYPLSTVSYVMACQKYSDASVGSTLKSYFTYAITTGQSKAASLQYAPLPASVVAKDKRLIATIS